MPNKGSRVRLQTKIPKISFQIWFQQLNKQQISLARYHNSNLVSKRTALTSNMSVRPAIQEVA